MHPSQFAKPAPCLAPFVRFYVNRLARIHGPTVIHPAPARPAPQIVFDFDDSTDVFYYGKQAVVKSHVAGVIGPQTHRRVELQLRGSLDTLVIAFQPDGLYRLFSIPMQEMIDCDFEAHSVLGTFITKLAERLGNSTSFAERVRFIEEALLPRALGASGRDGVSAAANRIMLGGGRANIPALAAGAGLSVRQLERRFIEQVGMRPKLFSRIVRFEAALESKARFAAESWTEVAHRFGYYDQMHMVHDFAEFTGGTPTKILMELETVFADRIEAVRFPASLKATDGDPRLIL